MGLDLYAEIEELIPFQDEIASLHSRYLALIKEFGAASVLDVGCGSGDFVLSLADQGISAKGIDLSCEMIRRAKAKGADTECVDIKDISDQVDIATAIFDVINYIPSEDLVGFFANIRRNLVDGGHFLFDINTLFGFVEVAVGAMVMASEAKHASVESDFEDDKLVSRFVLFKQCEDGNYCKNEAEIVQYFYKTSEIEKALKTAGFKTLGKFDVHLYGESKPDKMLFVARAI